MCNLFSIPAAEKEAERVGQHHVRPVSISWVQNQPDPLHQTVHGPGSEPEPQSQQLSEERDPSTAEPAHGEAAV